MEKYWHKIKYGFNYSDKGSFPTGDHYWDLTKKYLHTGILEIAQQNYKEDHPEIQLFIDILIQAGKDLHHSDEEIREDANRYIHSDRFESDCLLLGLNDEIVKNLLLKSLSNKSAILNIIENGDDDA